MGGVCEVHGGGTVPLWGGVCEVPGGGTVPLGGVCEVRGGGTVPLGGGGGGVVCEVRGGGTVHLGGGGMQTKCSHLILPQLKVTLKPSICFLQAKCRFIIGCLLNILL